MKTRANHRGCCGYDPWSILNERQRISVQQKQLRDAWNTYLEKTQEMRDAWTRGVLTLEQFRVFNAPFLREYQEQLTNIKGNVNFRVRIL